MPSGKRRPGIPHSRAAITVKQLSSNKIDSPISGPFQLSEFAGAVGVGGAEVYAISGRLPDSILMAADVWYYLTELCQASNTDLSEVSPGGVNIHVIAELAEGQIVVAQWRGLREGDRESYIQISANP